MSELFPKNDSDEVQITVRMEETYYMNHQNTTIYTYPRFPEVDHVYHGYDVLEDHKFVALFNSGTLIMMLRKLYFPEDIRPRPSEWDEKAYLEYQRQVLDTELEEF